MFIKGKLGQKVLRSKREECLHEAAKMVPLLYRPEKGRKKHFRDLFGS